LLGSSPQSAVWAAELGLPYVFADFINPSGAAFAQIYSERFEPSEYLSAPRLSLAVWAICAETDEAATDLSLSLRMMMTMLHRGRAIAVPSVEKAKRFIEDERVPLEMIPIGRRIIAGTPSHVRKGVESVAAEYGAEEVFLINILHNHSARRRSYELIAEEFGLTPATPELASATA
jgi:alkanesulfonate monooxygenase SsuD/methylene tetrahydromethanopterin reductase-like flavin-dependent oxidoreductase (luciferase family)